MTDWKDTFLCALLGCGTADLSLLDDCDVDMYDVVEECRDRYEDMEINNVVRTIFDMGIQAIETICNEKIAELKGRGNLSPVESVELEELLQLSPWRDVKSYHNFLDTSVWIDQNGEIYRELLPDALQEFERITGFSIRVN